MAFQHPMPGQLILDQGLDHETMLGLVLGYSLSSSFYGEVQHIYIHILYADGDFIEEEYTCLKSDLEKRFAHLVPGKQWNSSNGLKTYEECVKKRFRI